MPLVKLLAQLSERAIDHAAAQHGRARSQLLGPANDMLIVVNGQEFRRVVNGVSDEEAVLGQDRHIRDRIFIARDIAPVGEVSVQHIELALGFHRVAVDRIFDLLRRVGVEVPEATP